MTTFDLIAKPSKYELIDRLVLRAQQLDTWVKWYNSRTMRLLRMPHPALFLLTTLVDGLADHLRCPPDRLSALTENGLLNIVTPEMGPTFAIYCDLKLTAAKVDLEIGINDIGSEAKYEVLFHGTKSVVETTGLESHAQFYETATKRIQDLALEGYWRSR